MKIRVISDIHQEFYTPERRYKIEKTDSDGESMLVLAGDIGKLSKARTTIHPFLEDVSKQFKYVFYVGGNHEWYDGDLHRHCIEFAIEPYKNVVRTGIFDLEEENVTFIGDTLWSDFEGGADYSMRYCEMGMNDYRLIAKSHKPLTPEDVYALHKEQKEYIFKLVEKYSNLGRKIVVVTHHHPSWRSVLPQYASSTINGAFTSDLEDEIKSHSIDYWICGHMHNMIRYKLHGTEIICNPVGYLTYGEMTGYDPTLTIEV